MTYFKPYINLPTNVSIYLPTHPPNNLPIYL
jgi:hypothetical protein